MTTEIIWETGTLLRTLWWGMVFAAEYDCIRIFRRIVKHKALMSLIIEDIIYWIYISVKVFSICFYVNDGIMRAFIMAGFILGALLYNRAFSRYCVRYGVKLVRLLMKVLELIIIKPLKFILSVIRIVADRITYPARCIYIHIMHKMQNSKIQKKI